MSLPGHLFVRRSGIKKRPHRRGISRRCGACRNDSTAQSGMLPPEEPGSLRRSSRFNSLPVNRAAERCLMYRHHRARGRRCLVPYRYSSRPAPAVDHHPAAQLPARCRSGASSHPSSAQGLLRLPGRGSLSRPDTTGRVCSHRGISPGRPFPDRYSSLS